MVSNVDLLFRLEASTPPPKTCDTEEEKIDVDELQFIAPYLVETTTKSIDVSEDLEDDQVLIEAVCSLISSGTELKIYKGNFDDAALDTNIEGMTDERMEYPLAYGYSLVGRITHVGSNVSSDLVGKLAFTFSPHASHVITSEDAIQLVPEGISAEDAMFMPSVETALSLVHAAHIRVGEQVAVYGQGLIGLLVTSVLAMQKTPLDSQTGNFGIITAFDTIPERLAMASVMGASQALEPGAVCAAGPFDVSIEISGNAKALQSAIDHTRSGGRIVVGSWYGNNDVSLNLGIDFHRSHKTIQTSQVSDIPAQLRSLWSKERRFALTWELIKLLRPSRLLTKTTSLSLADEAYNALDQGKEIAVAFDYSL
jgi:threonine dehydrogenase-like Zn-dependent dehydrogenase